MAVAAPGLQVVNQRDFAAGAYPQNERIPDNGCEDIVNGLLDEDGSIFRRGGSVYLGTFAANPTASRPFFNLWSGYLGSVGKVTLASRLEGASVSQRFWAMRPGDTDFSLVWSDLTTLMPQRPVVLDGMLLFVGRPTFGSPGVTVAAWGGANNADVLNQNVTFTNGSKTVTGAGTAFLSAAPGMIVRRDATMGDRLEVIESIQSDTSLTLRQPWIPATQSIQVDIESAATLTAAEQQMPIASAETAETIYAASVMDRLVLGRGSRVSFTAAGDAFGAGATDYHELPTGAAVVGLEPLRDQLLVFSTQGVFVVGNLAFDLTDAFGNPQQRLERVAPDVVLWDNLGVAGWRGSVVAPCTDDVYLIDSAASMRPIAGGMRKLYRSYVNQGYRTGQAAVFHDHYLLPILSGTWSIAPPTWVDTLVCNLRTGAWTRWADSGATVRAFSTQISDDTREPQLLALGLSGANPRVLDLSGTFSPTAVVKNDADGTTHQLQVTTRSFSFGDRVRRQWRRLWARYELDDAGSDNPTVSLESAEDRVGTGFTSEAEVGSEGDEGHTWTFSKRARAIRFRLKSNGPSSGLRLRELEVFVRPSGRR